MPPPLQPGHKNCKERFQYFKNQLIHTHVYTGSASIYTEAYVHKNTSLLNL